MSVIKDHVVRCDEGFYDMQRYPERVEHGGTVVVTSETFRQMKGSDPSIRLLRIEPPKEILQAIVENARKEKAAREAAEVADLTVKEVADAVKVKEELIAEHEANHPEPEWKPIGWYAAQLAKEPTDA